MWWTRQRRRAMAVAGRDEPRERCTGAQDERRFSVRQNCVVLTPQRLASSLAEVLRAQPGGQNHIREATVSNKPDRRGEHGISRKAITQGMPDASAEPVCSCAHPLSHCVRDRGCSVHPAFPAPSCFRGQTPSRLGRIAPRDRGGMSFMKHNASGARLPFPDTGIFRHVPDQNENGLMAATRWRTICLDRSQRGSPACMSPRASASRIKARRRS